MTRLFLRVFPMALDGYFHEEEREKGEDGRLNEADEDLECEERYRHDKRDEEHHDQDEHLPREYIAEQTEREREKACKFGKKLDEADGESERRGEIDEFPRISEHAERDDAGNLDREKCDNGQGEGQVKVGCARIKKRDKAVRSFRGAECSDERQEAEPIHREDEHEDAHHEREQAFGEPVVPKGIADELIRERDKRLEDDLESRRFQAK